MQYIPCNSALLAQKTLFSTQKGTVFQIYKSFGIWEDPPPCWEKFPNNVVFFYESVPYALPSNRCSYCPLMQTWCESRRECRKRPRSDNIGRLWPDRVNLTPESSRRPRTFENNGNHCLLLHLISYKSMNICPIFLVANKQLIMEPNWMDRTDLFLRNNAVQQAGELRDKTDELT